MRTKYIISTAILSVGIAVSLFIVSDAIKAEAQTSTIQYPVAELGNCKSEAECRSYCDDSKNADTCFAFAEKHNLMSQEEIRAAKRFAKVGKGPGGCTSRDECDNYCNNSDHINECISFAEQNGMMSGKELEEAKKVQAAIAKGVKPPACGGKRNCDQYCSDPSHMEECISFGQAAGLMSPEEIQDSQKMLAALKKGAKPPACRGREECDKYCGDAAHMEECMTFAVAAGFMNPEEAQNSQKMLEAMRKGVKPPACRGKEECDKYCGEPSHSDECIAFAEAAGFMKPEEAAMARKTGGKGPGGCTSKESCEAFCNDPANQETCFNFGRDNGMIPQEDLQKMEDGKKQFSNMMNQAPAEALTCISDAVGSDNMEKFKSGSAMPSRDIGDKIGQCFGQMNQRSGGQGQGQEQRGQFQPGPGTTNPSGQMMPQQAGPGGCKTPEECRSFCESNPAACKNFGPGGSGSGFSEPGRGMERGRMVEGIEAGGRPGDVPNVNMPSVQEMQKFMQLRPGATEGGGQPNFAIPPSTGGTFPYTPEGGGMMQPNSGQSIPQEFQQQMQQFQNQQGQQMQQFQPDPFNQPPGGDGAPAPLPPPPTGSSLFDAVKSFLGI